MTLTDAKVKSAAPGKHSDGGGLRLVVSKSGSRRWVVRVTVRGRACEFGLGGYPAVSLRRARERALEARRLAADGVRYDQRPEAVTVPLREAAAAYIDIHRAGWRNAKHAQQWQNTLAQYVLPALGERLVNTITPTDVAQVLAPIWTTKRETADRLRGRLYRILRFARVKGWRAGENPADPELLHDLLPARPQRVVTHFPSMPWQTVPVFVKMLRQRESVTAAALAFTILTAARTSETCGARWEEVDMAAGLWTIPGTRMKAGRPHRVPLSAEAVSLLEKMRGLDTEWVFPSPMRPGEPLSTASMASLLKRSPWGQYTVHGMRGSFRNWCAEHGVLHDVAEQALAHGDEDRVVSAYKTTDMLDLRRETMRLWAQHCYGAPSVKVVDMVTPSDKSHGVGG